jgi:hypothetical protein
MEMVMLLMNQKALNDFGHTKNDPYISLHTLIYLNINENIDFTLLKIFIHRFDLFVCSDQHFAPPPQNVDQIHLL